MMRHLLAVMFVGSGLLLAQDAAKVEAKAAPQVVSMTPGHLVEVDATTTTQLVVVFDRDMSTAGYSFCGGGPTFPKLKGRPRWKDARTVVVDVALMPEHRYELGLNGTNATNFRSADGVALEPVRWTFWTQPMELPPAAEQRQRNAAALELLMDTLRERYSYYDLRVKDWARLRFDHQQAILEARTDRGFALAAAKMLQAAGDLHLWFKLGDTVIPTAERAVDPLWRRALLDAHFTLTPIGNSVLVGRSQDGIGYLMVATWSDGLDLAAIDEALAGLVDTKALVVDARPNAGGDESLAQQVAGWFVDGTKAYATDRFRKAAGVDGFGPVITRKVIGHGKDRHYAHPIAVLTSRCVMSSNESFVLMLKQAPDRVLVGQPTFGSSGNPLPHDLGNGVVAMVPSWQDMTPEGVCFEGLGLSPDLLVPCTAADLETHDPILEQALAVLRKKVRGGSGGSSGDGR